MEDWAMQLKIGDKVMKTCLVSSEININDVDIPEGWIKVVAVVEKITPSGWIKTNKGIFNRRKNSTIYMQRGDYGYIQPIKNKLENNYEKN